MTTLDKKIAIDQTFKDKIEGLIEDILVTTHGSGPKTKLKRMHNRLTFACPYCGDGSTDMLKKRGNLFWDTLYYHCYNYGCKSHKGLNEFINDFTPNGLDSSERLAVIDFIKTNNTKVVRNNMKYEIFEGLYKCAIPIETFLERTGSRIIRSGMPGFDYLKERLLHRFEGEFSYGNGKLYILNLTSDHKRIVGFQIRNLNKTSAKYLTYNIEKMYHFCGLELPEDTDIQRLNDVSTLFGILNINFTRPVTIFEGPIDAKFINNSLALCTVGRNVEQFTDIPTIRYMFDNDKAGRDAMRDLLKQGKEVFLWDKFIKEQRLTEIKKLKDLNDLIIACYQNKLDSYKYLNSYFSSNSLDSFYV
jgi:hypothetical protein